MTLRISLRLSCRALEESRSGSVMNILKNERYCGNIVAQIYCSELIK
jgi:hypothetical protein